MQRIIQISDCHLSANTGLVKHGTNTWQAYAAVLNEIESHGEPDLIIASGDIAEEPSQGAYQAFLQSLKVFSCPVFCVPGNHDDKQLMQSLISRHLDLAAWQIIGLDSNGPSRNEYGGFLVTQELEFLQQQLQASNKPTIVVMHHPAIAKGLGWLQSVKLENAHDFMAIIDAYPQVKGVVSGHIHFAYDLTLNGKSYLSCPSSYRQFDGEARNFALADGSRPGYRRLCLLDNGQIISEPCFIDY